VTLGRHPSPAGLRPQRGLRTPVRDLTGIGLRRPLSRSWHPATRQSRSRRRPSSTSWACRTRAS